MSNDNETFRTNPGLVGDDGNPTEGGASGGGRLEQLMREALEGRGLLPGSEKPAEQSGPFVSNLADDSEPAEENGVDYKLVREMGEVVRPCKPEEYEIGVGSKFAMGLPSYVDSDQDGEAERVEILSDGWNSELEQDARGWMHKAGLSHMEAAQVQHALLYNMRKGFTAETVAANEQITQSELVREYGTHAGTALDAARKVVEHAGGQKLKDFLNQTGLGSHPAVVKMMVRKAEQMGLFKGGANG